MSMGSRSHLEVGTFMPPATQYTRTLMGMSIEDASSGTPAQMI